MSDRLSLSQVAALMAYAATTTGGKTPALRGADLGPHAERIAGFLFNEHSFVALIAAADLSVDPLTPLSRLSVPRACIRAHTSACLPRFCRIVAIGLVIGIVLILCGLFFIAG